jgi:hypothetical protein
MPQSPNFIPTLHRIRDVALIRRIDAVEAHAIMPTAHERNVFGMRPAKWHRGAGRTTASQVWQVDSVPNLFGEHPALVRKIFHCCDERFWVAPGSQFIMAAFSC